MVVVVGAQAQQVETVLNPQVDILVMAVMVYLHIHLGVLQLQLGKMSAVLIIMLVVELVGGTPMLAIMQALQVTVVVAQHQVQEQQILAVAGHLAQTQLA
jgi:hypothetical protein